MSDIFRAYNYAPDKDSVKIPDVDFDLPRVTIESDEELPPEEAFMEFTPESFETVEEPMLYKAKRLNFNKALTASHKKLTRWKNFKKRI